MLAFINVLLPNMMKTHNEDCCEHNYFLYYIHNGEKSFSPETMERNLTSVWAVIEDLLQRIT